MSKLDLLVFVLGFVWVGIRQEAVRGLGNPGIPDRTGRFSLHPQPLQKLALALRSDMESLVTAGSMTFAAVEIWVELGWNNGRGRRGRWLAAEENLLS